TRLQGDWSSDVCSSDLAHDEMVKGRSDRLDAVPGAAGEFRFRQPRSAIGEDRSADLRRRVFERNLFAPEKRIRRAAQTRPGGDRSEERRVGKEGRCRGV